MSPRDITSWLMDGETRTYSFERITQDVVAGLEAGPETILVLTGVTRAREAERFPYRPSRTVDR
jgi:NagD protein